MSEHNSFADGEDFIALNAIRVEALYNNGVIPSMVTLFGAQVVFFSFWNGNFTAPKITWLVLLSIIICVRYITVRSYQTSKKLVEEYPFWLNAYFIGVIFSGLIIGSSIYVFIPEDNINHVYLFTIYALILLAGSIGIFSVFQRVYYGFNLPVIVPLIIFLISRNNEIYNNLGWLVCVFVFFILIIQFQSQRIMTQLLIIKLDNKNLLSNYELDRQRMHIMERMHNTKAKQAKELQEALKLCYEKLDHITHKKE